MNPAEDTQRGRGILVNSQYRQYYIIESLSRLDVPAAFL